MVLMTTWFHSNGYDAESKKGISTINTKPSLAIRSAGNDSPAQELQDELQLCGCVALRFLQVGRVQAIFAHGVQGFPGQISPRKWEVNMVQLVKQIENIKWIECEYDVYDGSKWLPPQNRCLIPRYV